MHYAKHTLGISAYLNGTQEPEDRFAEELQEILDFLGNRPLAKGA